MQLVGVQAAGAGDGSGPELLDRVPCLDESGRVGRPHLGPAGLAPVELGLDQRRDVDAVDRHVLEVSGDVDIGQLDIAHDHAGEVDAPEPGVGQVDLAEFGAAQVGELEPLAAKISTGCVHAPTVGRIPDVRLPEPAAPLINAPSTVTYGRVVPGMMSG